MDRPLPTQDLGDPKPGQNHYHGVTNAAVNDHGARLHMVEDKVGVLIPGNIGLVSSQVSLATTFAASYQEGGATVMAGTFTPVQSTAEVDVRVSASSSGWAGHHLDFHIGVLPDPAPVPWEPGGKNRIVKADNYFNTGLPGVTEYRFFRMPQIMPGVANFPSTRRIVLDGLTPGRVYQWELRCGGQSYTKACLFPAGAAPRYLSIAPDQSYVWVGCTGNNRLSLMQKGWRDFSTLHESNIDMVVVAEVALPGIPGGVACQPVSGAYVAVIDTTNNKLVLVDTATLTVTGSYTLPGSDTPKRQVVWHRDGTKLWVGGQSATNGGRVHRFNISTLTFDLTAVITTATTDGVGSPLDMAPDGSYLLATDVFGATLHKVATGTGVVSAFSTPGGLVMAGRVLADGRVLVLDSTYDRLLRYTSAGVYLPPAISTGGATGDNYAGSLALGPDEQQCYFVNGTWIGWAWVGSANLINTANWFGDASYGDVAVTADEGIIVGLPGASNRVHAWPGGKLEVRRSTTQNPFGAQQATVTFTGGAATGA